MDDHEQLDNHEKRITALEKTTDGGNGTVFGLKHWVRVFRWALVAIFGAVLPTITFLLGIIWERFGPK